MSKYLQIGAVSDDLQTATTELAVLGEDGDTTIVNAVIDTGLSEDAAVSPDVVRKLGLNPTGVAIASLADGSLTTTRTFAVTIRVGDAIEKLVTAVEAEVCLVGLPFFRGRRLLLDVESRGAVQIANLNALPAT